MIELPLSKGYITVIDDDDADLAEIKWTLNPQHKTQYAYRQIRIDGKKTCKALHREIAKRIAGRQLERNEQVDHIDGNGLNNRRSNIRICTNQQNQRNRSRRVDNALGFKGVSFSKGYKTKPYKAAIGVNGTSVYLGRFATPEEAHEAYCKAAKTYFGEFKRSS